VKVSVKVSSEQAILREAEAILLKHLGPAKAARFWAAWHRGAGDYLEIRERLFEGETVRTLYEKVRGYEQTGD